MIVVIILIITALASMYHKQIVTWLTPFTKWVYEYVLSLVLQRRYNDTSTVWNSGGLSQLPFCL